MKTLEVCGAVLGFAACSAAGAQDPVRGEALLEWVARHHLESLDPSVIRGGKVGLLELCADGEDGGNIGFPGVMIETSGLVLTIDLEVWPIEELELRWTWHTDEKEAENWVGTKQAVRDLGPEYILLDADARKEMWGVFKGRWTGEISDETMRSAWRALSQQSVRAMGNPWLGWNACIGLVSRLEQGVMRDFADTDWTAERTRKLRESMSLLESGRRHLTQGEIVARSLVWQSCSDVFAGGFEFVNEGYPDPARTLARVGPRALGWLLPVLESGGVSRCLKWSEREGFYLASVAQVAKHAAEKVTGETFLAPRDAAKYVKELETRKRKR